MILYALTIWGANYSITHWGFVPVGFGLMSPAGVYTAGLAFGFRDAIHERKGGKWVLGAVGLGTAFSYLVSPTFALASGVAFGLSELADFAVYSPIRKRRRILGVIASNTVGLFLDSRLFWYDEVTEKWYVGVVCDPETFRGEFVEEDECP